MKDKNETASRIKTASRIRKIRLSLGLTMKEFGKMFNPPASDSIVSRWERGVSLPSNDRLKRISEIANVSTTYLTTGEYTEYDLTDGNKSLFMDELKFRREKAKEDTLLRIEEEGILDPGFKLTILNNDLSDRIQNGGKNHKVTFNGQPLTIEELEYIESILIEFADINISEYSVDALKNIDEGFRELLSKYRSDK